MQYSKSSIISLALCRIGVNAIIAPRQDAPQAMVAERVYDYVRELVLRAHPWSFAMEWTRGLARRQRTVPGYAHAYALPADCLRVVDIRAGENLSAKGDDFTLVGQALCCNVADPLLRYVRNHTNEPQWPADFVCCFSLRLAAEAASLMAQDPRLSTQLLQLYQQELGQARTNDDAADATTPVDEMQASELLQARM